MLHKLFKNFSLIMLMGVLGCSFVEGKEVGKEKQADNPNENSSVVQEQPPAPRITPLPTPPHNDIEDLTLPEQVSLEGNEQGPEENRR